MPLVGISIRTVSCTSILTRSRIPSLDYVVNPYAGCAHGCAYCYVPAMPWMAGRGQPWGSYVDVRVNAAEALVRQLRRAGVGSVNLSTTTDPYQHAEEHYRITRACLGVLADTERPVSILTKLPLITRDIDVLRRCTDTEVGFSIASLDQELVSLFEPATPPVKSRLDALARLAESGIRTYAFCGPLLPFLSDSNEGIDRLFAELARVGVSQIIVDSLNLRGSTLARVCAALSVQRPDLVGRYRALSRQRPGYHQALMERAHLLGSRHGLTVRG